MKVRRVIFDGKGKDGLKEGGLREYPYSGINYKTETIILFTKKNTGTVLYHKDKTRIGEYKRTWNGDVFMTCPITVCFKNE